MISKESFYLILTQIKEDYEHMQLLNKTLAEIRATRGLIDGEVFFNSPLTAAIIDLLDDYFGEDCDWISYWVYELDCGNKWTVDSVVEKDGTPISLRTIDDVWEICNSYQEKDVGF